MSSAAIAAMSMENSHIAFCATTVWFLWDWVITIDSEVEHFWGKPQTTGSILYFTNRLLAVLAIVLHAIPIVIGSQDVCEPLVYAFLVVTAFSTFVVQTVLVLRTYALWDCNKQIYWSLMGINVAAGIVQQVLNAAIWLPGRFTTYPNPFPEPYTGCIAVFSHGTWQRFVPMIAIELTLAVFLLIKFVEQIQRGRTNRVLYILFRDGFIEFITVTIGSILCLVAGASKYGNTHDIDLITFDVTSSVSSICCARLLLNIKDVMTLSDPSDPLAWQPRWTLIDVESPPPDKQKHYQHPNDQQQQAEQVPEPFYAADNATAMPEMSQMDMFDDFFGAQSRVAGATASGGGSEAIITSVSSSSSFAVEPHRRDSSSTMEPAPHFHIAPAGGCGVGSPILESIGEEGEEQHQSSKASRFSLLGAEPCSCEPSGDLRGLRELFYVHVV
ncbi:hypothetical protein DL93DRAFT_2157348 [Clavulina sp. PMI_390]|nr:hypothetical protein DL93DRAFT_2157348 [Clavulina sp. PMI_390]